MQGHGLDAALGLGRAVQVEPMKPKLKAPGTNRLKLNSDTLLSSFAFNFNLRRYSWALRTTSSNSSAGAYTRPRFSST